MSSNNASGKVVSIDEQAFENAGEAAVDEDSFEVVDETPSLRTQPRPQTRFIWRRTGCRRNQTDE